MAGAGKRFIDKSYQAPKILLKINKLDTIFSHNLKNFKGCKSKYIFIISDVKIREQIIKNNIYKTEIKFILIKKHKQGPLKTLELALSSLKKMIKRDENIFLLYSDILWRWNRKFTFTYLKNKDCVVFTHKGYHPHLEVNSKSDFCKIDKNKIITDVKKKSFFGKDYKKNHLAIGLYYFNNLKLIENFFKQKLRFKRNNEYYIIDLIKQLIKNTNTYSCNLKKFVHLGFPEQYEDFLKWSNLFKKSDTEDLFQDELFEEFETIMLAGGKGTRLKKILNDKLFLKINNSFFYKKIFQEYGSKIKTIITNKNIQKTINENDINLYKIKKTKSMFETLIESKNFLIKRNNFFLTSCDCIGRFDKIELRELITNAHPDLIFFGFQTSYLQKKIGNSHSYLKTINRNVRDISVKSKPNGLYFGHAGFFWIKNGKIFEYLNLFKSTDYYKKLDREPIIDDYFKFLIKSKKIKSNFIQLKNYLHLGSENEYQEYNYWKGYFKVSVKEN